MSICLAYKHAQPTQTYETLQVYINKVQNASIFINLSKAERTARSVFSQKIKRMRSGRTKAGQLDVTSVLKALAAYS